MATCYPLQMGTTPLQQWARNPHGYHWEEDDPVPPQFATRYAAGSQAACYLPPPPYSTASESKYCVAPCCAVRKGVTIPFMAPHTTFVTPSYGVQWSTVHPMTHGTLLPAANTMQRSTSRDAYKEEFGKFPVAEPVEALGEKARPLVAIPTFTSTRDDMHLDEVDHPSYMHPPHLSTSQEGVGSALSPNKVQELWPGDPGYAAVVTSSPVYTIYDLIPAGPMPAAQPLAMELSGATIADAAASVLFDLYAGRFGAIGAPSPTRSPLKGSLSLVSDPGPGQKAVTRGDFVLFARSVLQGTRVASSVVANAVSYLCDVRLRHELRARSLQLSFVAALSISHKTTDDSPFTTSTWAKLAELDVQQLRGAEFAICYGLDFDLRPELNAERFIDATNLLMTCLSPDSQGRRLLNSMLDSFILSPF